MALRSERRAKRMTGARRALLVAAALVHAFAARASCAPTIQQSLEMTAAESPLVVRGVVTDARVYGSSRGEIDQTRVVVRVEEALKGTPPEPLVFAAYEMTSDAPIRARDIGQEMLFFLQPSQLGTAERRDCAGCEWELVRPTDVARPIEFIRLSGTVQPPLLDADLQYLDNPLQILARLRAACRIKADHAYTVQIASGDLVTIPDEEQFLPRDAAWMTSTDVNQRLAAVDIFAIGSPEQGTSFLRALLNDDYLEPLTDCMSDASPWTTRHYPVRCRAAAVLKRWLPQEPEFIAGIDPGFYRPAPWKSVIALSAVLLTVIVVFRKKRTGGLLIWKLWLGLAFGLALAGGWSCRHAIDLARAEPGSLHSLTLAGGRLEFREVSMAAPWGVPNHSGTLVWGWFANSLETDATLLDVPTLWHHCRPPEVAPATSDGGLLGIRWRSGSPRLFQFPGPLANVRYLAVPLWPLILISSLPALAVAVRRVRRSRLRNTGHCGECGYDLRKHRPLPGMRKRDQVGSALLLAGFENEVKHHQNDSAN